MSNNVSAWPYLYHEDLYNIPSPVLIILSTPWEAVSEDQKILLTKILASVKLHLSQVQVLHMEAFSPAQLPVTPTRIIAFGASLKSSGQRYEHIRLNDIELVLSDSLEDLDDAKKKSLWMALKKMFGI